MKSKYIGRRYIGQGQNAKCYLLRDQKHVYKQFKEPLELFDLELERYQYFLDCINDSVCFPYKLNIKNNVLYGYYLDYVLGKRLFTVFSSSILSLLAQHSLVLEKDIIDISKKHILMIDVHDQNILYNYHKLSVIDIDSYQITNLPLLQLQKYNLNSYKEVILDLLESQIVKSEDTKMLKEELLKYYKNNILASEMLYKISDLMVSLYGKDIQTVNDLNQLVKKK